MFKDMYKNAYDPIKPSADSMDKIRHTIETKKKKHCFSFVMRPVFAAFSLTVLLGVLAVPVLAKEIPTVYRILEAHTPALLNYIAPEELSCTSNGINMQVEAINITGTEANIVISFSDEEGYDFIHGKVDLYDSYNLSSYDADSIIGGCSFLEYDEQEDKAYFNIDVTSEQPFDKEKLIFQVGQLLTNCGSEQKEIDLSNLIENPATKTVECNGYSWNSELSRLPSYLNPENESIPILDLSEIDKSMLHDLTITGTAYTDGILRIQTCRGSLSDADRHLEAYLVNSDGTQQCEDFSVGWQEEINGEVVSFTESWFLVDAEQLANSHMYGIYHTTDNQIVGDWKVTFRVE